MHFHDHVSGRPRQFNLFANGHTIDDVGDSASYGLHTALRFSAKGQRGLRCVRTISPARM